MSPKIFAEAMAAFALLSAAGSALSQHHPARAAGPYAGQQAREIKALSAEQTEGLLTGRGMELAKAAELNSYPGPMHTLELAAQLELSVEQQQASQALMDRHKAQARALGQQLVEAERALDSDFLLRQIDAARLADHMQAVGRLQAALRQAHLETHLQQSALLTAAQISLYAELRGYTSPAGTPHKH